MDHVGWTLRHTALYYMQLAKVLNPSGASARLASDEAVALTGAWQDTNQLKQFGGGGDVSKRRAVKNLSPKGRQGCRAAGNVVYGMGSEADFAKGGTV